MVVTEHLAAEQLIFIKNVVYWVFEAVKKSTSGGLEAETFTIIENLVQFGEEPTYIPDDVNHDRNILYHFLICDLDKYMITVDAPIAARNNNANSRQV